jgi:importin subunit alpha-6/7
VYLVGVCLYHCSVGVLAVSAPACRHVTASLTHCIALQVALEGLKNILAAGEKQKDMPGSANTNTYGLILEEAGGLDLLESLQNHTQEEIANKAVDILSSYFEAATDDNETAAPGVGTQGMYDFAAYPMNDESHSGGEASFNFGGV